MNYKEKLEDIAVRFQKLEEEHYTLEQDINKQFGQFLQLKYPDHKFKYFITYDGFQEVSYLEFAETLTICINYVDGYLYQKNGECFTVAPSSNPPRYLNDVKYPLPAPIPLKELQDYISDWNGLDVRVSIDDHKRYLF